MRTDLLQDMMRGETGHRDYDTIRKAVECGMNFGAFGLDEESSVAFFEWRLFGDRVEIRENGKKAWSFLAFDNLDFVYSRGVTGQNVEQTIAFLCYDLPMPQTN